MVVDRQAASSSHLRCRIEKELDQRQHLLALERLGKDRHIPRTAAWIDHWIERVRGHEHYPDTRVFGQQSLSELGAYHPGHDDITEHEVYRFRRGAGDGERF